MTYNILGVNPGHNGSVALLVDGELVYYVEEERLSRLKYDANPFKAINDILSKWHIDEVIVGGTSSEQIKLPWTGEDPCSALVRKYNPNVKFYFLGAEHHLGHAACAFYNSGFKNAICLVVDGCGSYRVEKLNDQTRETCEGFETESIWSCEYPNKIGLMYRNLKVNNPNKGKAGAIEFDDAVTLTKTYEAVSHFLGFGFIEAGKTMGLAPYGKEDENIPNLFIGNKGSKDVFIPFYPAGAFIDQQRQPYLRNHRDPNEWHHNPEKLTDMEKNLAWKIQKETQKILGDMIENVVNESGITNVAISGGYGLNCVANYYLVKRFPNVNFYFEPIANDGGTAIGLAKFAWHSREVDGYGDYEIRPQNSLYLGPTYTKKEIQKVIDSYKDKITIENVSYDDVAKLIADRNIVALFQGRSEAGPRALGNRSILYDPRDSDGKDHVNTVKGREWFRPFAGTVLEEDGNEWFDLAGQGTSPFMMMAVNVVADKLDQIPAICHVDDTCRVQTINETQNEHYYNLIKAFKDITGVPVLFNTSFNLAGDPLVETISDALNTLERSELKYIYLPELGILVKKNEEA